MSLDVHLKSNKPIKKECPCCGCKYKKHEYFYQSNITHNLWKMAAEAGIYKHLWRPEELGITKAKELIKPIREGLKDMKARPKYYEQFNSPNGWGTYEHFIPWIEKYLTACIEYPDAVVEVDR